jgi:hypothetical protein
MSKPDNNIDRVVYRARQNNAILYWQCVNYDGTSHKNVTYVDDIDLPAYERQNNVGMRWLITPVLDLTIVDYNGNPRS